VSGSDYVLEETEVNNEKPQNSQLSVIHLSEM
jgi:hypothetical protein